MVSFKNVALLSFATSALACVDFTATLNNFQFASIRLVDNGQEICTYNGYGDNNGYNLRCKSGYSGRLRFSDKVVEYKAPHGSWTFATNCQGMTTGTPGGSVEVCQARVFGC
ncbi:hypothetical protein CPLU01_08501 [Colletotrichum plurivorum]|uniref:CVNH domain-containing protein n=2 Tax=Colletotrichum orchidearum species complex TaxID=2707337 RepID=A0A8H6KBU5_9PEZI|nr:hypothetical protein CPLU01_08501 [Colletotrichum plurivorum]